ncbi:polysaccharide deacetylase family protein [Haladaptatus sp. AB618]|nr:polysaccharide deacetylase family protein [Haladaptatus sp. AB618]MCO8254749.1 polysaccharide deacetylase family protein [Haladaptatus sp. AB618]
MHASEKRTSERIRERVRARFLHEGSAVTGTPTSTRRGFCASVGAVSLSLLSSPVTARSTDGPGGRVVFIYDDSPEEDYTETFPVHQDEGVPGCIAAVSDRIGHSSWLSPKQLREMEGDGWEIMSHSVRHRALGAIAVTQDIEPGDTKVYVESNFHSRVPGDEIVVENDNRSATFTVADGGEDSSGEYLVSEKPLRTGFTAVDGVTERYTDERIRRSLADSKRTLEGFGVDISAIVLPFGRTQGRVQELIPEYYDVLANQHHGGFNPRKSLDPYHLGRTVFRGDDLSASEIGDFLDRVRKESALGIFVGHSREETLTPARVRETIRMSKDRNLEITTLRDALTDFGVVTGNRATTTATTRSTATQTTTDTASRSSATGGRTATPDTTSDAGGTDGDGESSPSPSMEQLGAVSVLGALGAGVLTYARRNE